MALQADGKVLLAGEFASVDGVVMSGIGRLHTDGYDPVGSTPQEFARIIARDIATWSKVVKTGNIKAE